MKFVLAALALAAGSLSAQTLKGITVDKTKALDLYQQAVAAGNNRAQQNIDRLQGKNVAVE